MTCDNRVRLVDALYIELASRPEATILTTDFGMATAAAKAEITE
ncbi:MAG: hypothetical protein PVJ28_00080 [Acidimicrobiia bacterium]|jgi:predicted nucleic acid-binding protein